MIEITGLTKKYGKTTALEDVNFVINKGELVGIVGSNGAGKSTLISIMATIIKPTKGDVKLDGQSIIKRPKLARGRIGYVPQEITLFSNFTVKENLYFWDTMSNNHSATKAHQNIQHITQVAGLERYLSEKVGELSGGLKRRVNLAIALLSQPDILIMDEPTVGMDMHSRSEMIKFIKELSSDGTTIIYISHHGDEIEQLCNHIICLNQGRLVFDGTQEELRGLSHNEAGIDDIILSMSEPI